MTLISKIYANTKETLRTADKLVMALVMLIIASIAIAVPAYAASGSGSGSGSRSEIPYVDGTKDLNISSFSGLITDSFCDMMSGVINEGPKVREELLEKVDYTQGAGGASLSTAGNMLGFQSNIAQQKDGKDIFTAGDDAMSRRLNISSVMGWYDGIANMSADNSSIAQYIMFGSAINYLGIDEFRDAKGNGDGLRMIIGYIMYICFILAYSASGIMNAVVDIMSRTNVFGWLHNQMMSGNSGAVEGVNANLNGTTSNLAFIRGDKGLMATLKGIYAAMYDFRWVIFGLMVVLFVASITVFKSKQMGQAATTQTRARNLLLRVVIMCIGIPLVGMVYSTTLSLVDAGLDKAKYCVTDFVYTQFLDFEDWTVTEPGDAFQGIGKLKVTYNSDDQSMIVTSSSGADASHYAGGNTNVKNYMNTSEFVYNINKEMYDFLTADYTNTGHTVEQFYATNSQAAINDVYGDILKRAENSGNKNNDQTAAYAKARDLILGYARGNVVDADKINERYIKEYNDVIESIYGNNAAAPDDEKRNTVNSMLARIFNNTPSSTRVWNHYEDSPKEYPGYGDYNIVVKGTPIFPDATSDAPNINYIKIENGDKEYALMTKVLNVTRVSTMGLSVGKVDFVTDGLHGTTTGNPMSGGALGSAITAGSSLTGPVKTYNYTFEGKGMSPLALYNFLHSKFELGTLDIYTPDLTANSGVSTMHYSITTPYAGIPEIIQLLHTIVMLFSIGILGWVFGMSLMINTMVQMIKAIPLIFKMAIGSIQGFVEALLTVLSIVAELLVTITLYVYAVEIIDFILAVADHAIRFIMNVFWDIEEGETYSIFSNLFSMLLILWGIFELIKWRQAITISIKSMLTHVLNTVFGTSASMPTGASSGMLKAAALGGAAMMTAGALAEQGALDDVVNDMTQSDLGSSVGDKLKEGDAAGAWNDIKDYANGEYAGDIRGGSAMDKEAQSRGLLPAYNSDGSRMRDEETGEAMYTDGNGNTYTASEMQDMPDAYQDLTEDQAASMNSVDDQIASERALADEAEKNGDAEGAAEHRAKAEQLSKQRAGMDAEYRAANYAKAKEAGVANYADYERTLSDSGSSGGGTHMPEAIEGDASIPEEPSKELGRDEQAVYNAAREGDAKTLQSMGGKYNNHGLTADQVSQVDEAIANGASETDVAAMVDGFAQENFGDDYKNVVDQLNEANGRSGNATYGTNDNSEGNARTVHVATSRGTDGQLSYGVTDNNSQAGAQQIVVSDDGQGGVSYTNMTAGGGNANTIETVDMGSASNAGAEQYATTFNSTAAMIRLSGGSVSNANVGMGGAQQVTITEMAAMSSRQQMAANNISVNAQAYGNSDAADVGMAMTNVQAQATIRGAASGQQVQAPAYTPLTISSEAGKAAGVATYQTKISDVSGSQAPAVTLERTGGAENTGPQTIKVDYSGSANGGNSGGTNYVSVGGSKTQETVAVNMTGEDGQLKMPSRDDLLKAAVIKAAVDAISNDGEGDGDNGGSGRHR